MVRVDGIEPTTSAWKADVLPLNYTRVIKARKMPPSPPLGQDRNSGKTPFFTPHRPFLKLLPQLTCGHRDNAPHFKASLRPQISNLSPQVSKPLFRERDRRIHRLFFDKILQDQCGRPGINLPAAAIKFLLLLLQSLFDRVTR